MATRKSNTDSATQATSAGATQDNQQNVQTAAQDPAQGSHVAVHTIQYFDAERNTVVEVKAGSTFTPPEKDIEALTNAGAIREASQDDLQRNTSGDQGERQPGPAGYADNTTVQTAVYPGGVTNPNDIPPNAGDNTSAEPSASTDAALDSAPVTSRTTTR